MTVVSELGEKMSYKIAFLNDEEFERLPMASPYTKLGVAYPEYGEAYIRKSGSNLVDVFTLAHELEHLQGATHGEHYDQENKCYYKDFGNMLGPIGTVIGSLIPGVGPMVGPAIGGALGGAGSSIFGQGSKQPSQPQQSGVMSPFQTSQGPGTPNVSQAVGVGASGGSGSGGSVGGGLGAGNPQGNSQMGGGQNAYDPFNNNKAGGF